ncbi:unnamed protein product [Calypogeia fissa]
MDGGGQGETKAWLEEAEVMSEVHVGTEVGIRSTVSVFEISLPAERGPESEDNEETLQEGAFRDDGGGDESGAVRTDEHGDLVLPRRTKKRKAENPAVDAVLVHHHVTTLIPQVGLQIWRGALLLSDFILHIIHSSNVFNNVTALELGSGTGLAGLVMARDAQLVFLTDIGGNILENCSRNVIMNVSSLSKGESTVRVRELDWQKPWPPHLSDEEGFVHSDKIGPYQWIPEDIKDAGMASVFLAADVVYSEHLTTAFFETLKQMMPLNSDKCLYLAMEKRYNFSVEDLDVVAHGYKHFRTFFTSDCPLDIEPGLVFNAGEVANEKIDTVGSSRNFFGKKIDVDGIPQYIRNYDRGDDLELWEIRPWKDVGNLANNRP